MEDTKKQPTKTDFIFWQGGAPGIWRGLFLSEAYAVLLALTFIGIILIDRTGDIAEALSYGLLMVLFAQVFGVLPAILIGFAAGLLIANATIALQERSARTASKLAAAVAISLSILVDLFIQPEWMGIFLYSVFLGIPTLVFALVAVLTTRRKLPAVEENFKPGNLSASIVNGLFWAALVLKVAILAYIFFVPS